MDTPTTPTDPLDPAETLATSGGPPGKKVPGVACTVGGMSTPRTPIAPDQLALAPADAARVLGVSRATFFKLHSAGRLPLPIYLTPRCPRWVRAELLDWLAAGAPDRQTWEKLKAGGKR